ncbi:hypothetical protein F4776DRAFT_668809 [Hypoxylon sp. NC0597]|nr:hypothetical protein F4776DRAFT_668809 [Hypoxylon sp. NC0597]
MEMADEVPAADCVWLGIMVAVAEFGCVVGAKVLGFALSPLLSPAKEHRSRFFYSFVVSFSFSVESSFNLDFITVGYPKLDMRLTPRLARRKHTPFLLVGSLV